MRSKSPRPATGTTRRTLRKFLDRLIVGDRENADPRRGRLMLESLEKRQLLAGDVDLFATDPADNSPDAAAESATGLQVAGQAEGLLVNDLQQFAIDLADAGVQFFGANWCPACTQQKELFDDGKDNLPFIEVTGPDRELNQIGIDEDIRVFPTWEFPDGSRLEGILSLETLSARSGVPIPQGETPIFEPIGNMTVQVGSPIHVPVDAYDPDGGPLTVTVEVANSSLVEGTVLSGNRSIRIDMETYGDMVFQLFEQRAPVASGRVADLAESGFYDGIIFHRIFPSFVIQAGDPGGDGTGGSDLGDFDDDFHPDLQHNMTGVLSYAKSTDDTNDSQFFIIEGPQRFLDFNHSVFGKLVEGDDVREAISSHAADGSDKPTIPITIETIDVFNDTENGLIMFKAAGTQTGSTTATITVTDQDGRSHSETIQLDIVPDTANSQPFLNDIPTPAVATSNVPVELQLSSIDVEGDAVTYFANAAAGSTQNISVAVDSTSGLVTVTPVSGFQGTADVFVGVQPGPNVTGNAASDFDSQTVTFTFEAETVATPAPVDLLASSDSGISSTDNVTNEGTLTFTVSGVTSGALVELVIVDTGASFGEAIASGSTVNITTSNIAALGDGTYQVSARQTVSNITSEISTPISLVYDTTAPSSVVASAATQGNVNREFVTDLISDEEGSGLRYALSSSPFGTTIDPATGLITWTPTESNIGLNEFIVELTDAAGNVLTESFQVDVNGEPLAEIKLQITDLQGNEITAVSIGQEFLLNFIGVDARGGFDREGIFGAFADILFDSSIVRPVDPATIDYVSGFTVARDGEFRDGEIDELGAASSSLTASGDRETLIATIRMEALATGTVNIRSEPADKSSSEVLLYGNDDQIPAGDVAYGSATLAVGQSFTVTDDTATVLEDSGATIIDVLANDEIVTGTGTLSVVSVTQPIEGGAVTLESGVVRFTPTPDFDGQSVFTYRVSDSSNGVQESATVTVTVTPINDPPTGVADNLNVDQNSSNNSLDVLANDIDDGDTLTVTDAVTTTAGAIVTVAADGQSVLYTPPADFTGVDTFTYTLSDGTFTDTAEVTVTVAPADPPPTAVDNSFDVDEDDSEAEFDILSNDTRDASDEPFVISAVGTPTSGGSARASADGTQFFYAPAADFFGTEEVSYTIRDTGGGLSTATVTFTVAGVNDAPPISNPTIPLNRAANNTPVFDVSDLPANVDSGETLTFSDLGTPTAGGTVSIDPTTGAILYSPPSADFVGEDTFTYTVRDGSDLTSTGTITINVTDFKERNIFFDASSSLVERARIRGIKLLGTDALGNAIDMPLTYGTSGAVFENVLPGDYMVEIPAIPFLQKASAPTQISITSAPEEGNSTVTADLGRLRPEFISIRDWLGSAPVVSILAVVAPGESHTLAMPSSTAETITAEVDLDTDESMLTIRGTRLTESEDDEAGLTENIEAEITSLPRSAVQVRGRAGDLQLLRISLEEGDVSFNVVTDSTASSTAPEGEFIEPVAESTSSLSLGGLQAEGESIASAAVTQADLFVPAASDVSTRSDATVLSLQQGDVWIGESLVDNESKASNIESQNVDEAMSDVAPILTIESATADSVAERAVDQSAVDSSAIDAALSEAE